MTLSQLAKPAIGMRHVNRIFSMSHHRKAWFLVFHMRTVALLLVIGSLFGRADAGEYIVSLDLGKIPWRSNLEFINGGEIHIKNAKVISTKEWGISRDRKSFTAGIAVEYSNEESDCVSTIKILQGFDLSGAVRFPLPTRDMQAQETKDWFIVENGSGKNCEKSDSIIEINGELKLTDIHNKNRMIELNPDYFTIVSRK